MKHFLWLALRNLRRNRRRNLATGSAIAFGFAGILLLAGYSYRVKNYLRVYTIYVIHTGHLAIFPDDGLENFSFQPVRFSLTNEDQKWLAETLRADPGVIRFERQIRGQGLIGNGCATLPFVAQGFETDIDRALHENPEVQQWMPNLKFFLAGRGIWNFPDDLHAISLSKGLFQSLGKTRVHDEVANERIRMVDCQAKDVKQQLQRDANVQLLSNTWSGGLSAVDGEIVGEFTTGVDESDLSTIMTSIGLLQKLFDTDHVTEMAVWLKAPDQIADAVARLKEKFVAAGKHFTIIRWDDEKISPYYAGTIQFLDTLVFAVSLILATVIALSVLNSTTMTILERSQEIGMYRSMGFRRWHVRVLYLFESLWLSLFSLAAGWILARMAATGINAAGITYYPPGVAGGMKLMLILNWVASVRAGLLIVVLVLIATFFAVSARLKNKPADLLGGTLR